MADAGHSSPLCRRRIASGTNTNLRASSGGLRVLPSKSVGMENCRASFKQQASHENMPDLRDASNVQERAGAGSGANAKQATDGSQAQRGRIGGRMRSARPLDSASAYGIASHKNQYFVGIALPYLHRTTLAFRVPSRVQGNSSIKKQAAKKMVMSTGERMGRRVPQNDYAETMIGDSHGTAYGRKVVEVDGAIG